VDSHRWLIDGDARTVIEHEGFPTERCRKLRDASARCRSVSLVAFDLGLLGCGLCCYKPT